MILAYALIFTGLVMIAAWSPLLTFAHLWQLKEWRVDRLQEHLRANGWWQQLFGKVRPPLIIGLLLFSFVVNPLLPGAPIELAYLFILSILSLVQLITGKQPKPVWTMKAVILVCGTTLLTIIVTMVAILATDALVPAWNVYVWNFTLLLPLLQPVLFALVWLAFWPVDRLMKRRTFFRAAAIRAGHPSLTVIGITGSVGKTTTKELLAHILKSKNAIATPEHVNTEMGVAQWLTKILRNEPRDSTKIVIVEMGAYRMGEIALLCQIAQPTMGIITSIGTQHLSLFGSREAIIQAKGELFASLPTSGRAFVNKDNDAADALIKRCRCPVTTVGTSQHPDVSAYDVEETQKGVRFRVEETVYDSPLSGTHTVTAALLAIAVARQLGMKPAEIAAALKTFQPLKRTFEVKEVNGLTILDDTHNSSVSSVQAAIRWADGQPHDTKILLLQGVIELGEAEGRIHRDLAGAAKDVFDDVYVGDPRFLPYFSPDFGEHAHLASARTEPVAPGALLVCLGRLSPSIMKKFLP